MEDSIKQRAARVNGVLSQMQEMTLHDSLHEPIFHYLLDDSNRSPSPIRDGDGDVFPEEGEKVEPFASAYGRAGVGAEVFRHVFSVDADGAPELVVSVRRLASTDAEATRQIALLMSGVRQSMGLEDWTSTGQVRDWAKRYSRFDSKNFAKTVTDMQDEFTMRGSGASRELRLTMPGWEAWSALVAELAAA